MTLVLMFAWLALNTFGLYRMFPACAPELLFLGSIGASVLSGSVAFMVFGFFAWGLPEWWRGVRAR